MVVSPALAEISAVTKAEMEGYAAEDDALAFHELCLIPAMRKIQQALGRFVRQYGDLRASCCIVSVLPKLSIKPCYRTAIPPSSCSTRRNSRAG